MVNMKRFMDVCVAYTNLRSGVGFTIYAKLDEFPNEDAIAAAQQAGYEEIDRRLLPIAQLIDQLVASLRERKQFFELDNRPAFKTDIQWTDEQLGLLDQIEKELNSANQFIKV